MHIIRGRLKRSHYTKGIPRGIANKFPFEIVPYQYSSTICNSPGALCWWYTVEVCIKRGLIKMEKRNFVPALFVRRSLSSVQADLDYNRSELEDPSTKKSHTH